MRSALDSFEQSLKADLSDLAYDMGDTLFSSASGLPIFSLLKTASSIQNLLFGRKVMRFLGSLKDIPYSDRVKFLERAVGSRQSTGDLYLLLLNTLNGLNQEEKADIVGFIFKLMIYEDISIEVGLKLITIVSRLDFTDLRKISHLEEDALLINQHLIDSLSGTGTLTSWFQNLPADVEGYPAPYRLNQIGKALLNTMKKYEEYIGSQS